MELIKIGCPNCGNVLGVKNISGIETKYVTCPICHFKAAFINFKRIGTPISSDDRTKYPDDKITGYNNSLSTSNSGVNNVVGSLKVLNTGQVYQLKPGVNIVGRMAQGSEATIALPNVSKKISRNHLVIEVNNVPGKGMVHYVSLCKSLVNLTSVGNSVLEFGDKIILNNGDIIHLPDVEIRFELPDLEQTVF